MSAIPEYTRTEINSLRVGPLKEALSALGLHFNGGVGEGRKILKAALYPPSVVTGAASQPNPPTLVAGAVTQPNLSQLSGASGSAKHGSASQPNLSHVSIQPSGAPANLSHVVPIQSSLTPPAQAAGSEKWHLLSQSSSPVYTRIPVASRNKASYVYGSILNNLIKANKNDNETAEMAWQKFFDFARRGLGSSKRGGTKHTSQATIINKRLDAFVSGSVVPEPPPKKTTKAKSSKPPETLFASRVSAKLSMGDVRGAVTVVTSRESILTPSQETKELLQAKHPPTKKIRTYTGANS